MGCGGRLLGSQMRSGGLAQMRGGWQPNGKLWEAVGGQPNGKWWVSTSERWWAAKWEVVLPNGTHKWVVVGSQMGKWWGAVGEHG